MEMKGAGAAERGKKFLVDERERDTGRGIAQQGSNEWHSR